MFALVIMGRQSTNYASDHVNFGGRWLNTKNLVIKALTRVYDLFGIDFREDGDLIAGLKMHLHGLIEREKNDIQLENLFLEEIKQKYPLIFEMGISLFVDSNTESAILRAINKLDKKGFHLEFTTYIGNLIQKKFYFQDLDYQTPEEIIHFLCQRLENEGNVDSGFVEVVLKREEMSPTSFVNAFAIPHAFGAVARSSAIAVAHLKNPVRWGDFEISLVMLFAINEGDHRVIKMFFEWISTIINNPKQLEELCETCEYEQFIERITD